MANEIEYKFLIKQEEKNALLQIIKNAPSETIKQGYLNTEKECTVRVRIKSDKGFLTIKGTPNGISKPEYEYEIPLSDAEEMMFMCEYSVSKTRYKVYAGNDLYWEIDFFSGLNDGLIMAELEVPSEDTIFSKPLWIGQDVSLDSRYANSQLSLKPFSTW